MESHSDEDKHGCELPEACECLCRLWPVLLPDDSWTDIQVSRYGYEVQESMQASLSFSVSKVCTQFVNLTAMQGALTCNVSAEVVPAGILVRLPAGVCAVSLAVLSTAGDPNLVCQPSDAVMVLLSVPATQLRSQGFTVLLACPQQVL